MKAAITLLFVFLLQNLSSLEYKISPLGLEKINARYIRLTGFNDKGETAGIIINDGGRDICLFVTDKNDTYIIKNNTTYYCDQEKIILNNNNCFTLNKSSDLYFSDEFSQGFIGSNLNIKKSSFELKQIIPSNISELLVLEDINDNNIVIGKYIDDKEYYNDNLNKYEEYLVKDNDLKEYNKCFIWNNGELKDLNLESEFAIAFLEPNCKVMQIEINSINNNNDIAGYFVYGKYNKIKNSYTKIGKKIFVWRGYLDIMNYPHFPYEKEYSFKIKINNNGTLLYSRYDDKGARSYVWKLNENIQILENFIAISMNDNETILGYFNDKDNINDAAIFKDGRYIKLNEILKQKDLNCLADSYSDNFNVEKIHQVTDINNNEQIAAIGLVWGSLYPCIIEPAKE